MITRALIVLACAHSCALAQPIPVANHSFEIDPADPGCFEVNFIPTGWLLHDPLGLADQGNFFGVLDPGSTTYFEPGQVPDGDQVALLFFTGSIGQGALGIRQPLAVSLEPNRRYVLSVGVGNIASGASPSPPCPNGNFFDLDAFPGYRVELVAGDTVIECDDNSLFGSLPDGFFATSTVVADVYPNHAQLGQELEIRLINLNEDDPTDPDDPGIEVDFDNVVLEAFELPCPADLTTTGSTSGDPGFGTPDSVTNLSDLLFFVNVWNADLGSPSPAPGSPADLTTTGANQGDPSFGAPDGNVDLADLLFYVNEWTTGLTLCP